MTVDQVREQDAARPGMRGSGVRYSLGRLMRHIGVRRTRQLGLLVGLLIVGALAELLSLGAIVPFITVLAKPEQAATLPVVAELMLLTGIAPAQLTLAVSMLFAVLVLFAAGIRLSLLWATIKFANGLGAELGCTLYARTLQRPYSFHVSRNTSEIVGSMNKVQRLIGGYVLPLLTTVSAATLSLAVVVTLVLIEPWVSLGGAAIFGGSYFLTAILVRRRLREDGLVVARANDQRIQAMQEGLGGIRDVILDRSWPVYTRRFARIEERFRAAQARTLFLAAFPRLTIEAMGLLLLSAFAVYYGSLGKDFGSLLPVLGALAVGAQKLMPLVQQIYNGWSSAVASQASVNNVLDLLDFEPPPQLKGPPIRFTEEIRLQGVTFQYAGAASASPVLRNVDLFIRRGERIGIVGPTGSGKSTLVDLLMGLLLPSDGHFLVDGQEVTTSNADSWQRHIAHVPQSIFLSDTSIAENIALGLAPSNIDRARLEKAARVAQIHDHIVSLPQGYDTAVGERGVRLSGGQRQRIGVARALYRQAEVLVLDEATSALDDETEGHLMRALTESVGNMTVIMIAHRVSTMQSCDRILHLERGRIQTVSTYAGLIAGRASEPAHA